MRRLPTVAFSITVDPQATLGERRKIVVGPEEFVPRSWYFPRRPRVLSKVMRSEILVGSGRSRSAEPDRVDGRRYQARPEGPSVLTTTPTRYLVWTFSRHLVLSNLATRRFSQKQKAQRTYRRRRCAKEKQ